MKILLAKPRGFCAGVDRAIDIVELALQAYGQPVYVKHEIVHNKKVVESLKAKGTIFVEDLKDVPKGSLVIFSAHGAPPSLYKEAEERGLRVLDATCPLVTKVHLEAKRFASEGYTIILIGHKGHVEMEGTMGEAPDSSILIESVEEVTGLKVPDGDKLAYLTQTTLSVDDTAEIIEALKKRFPNIVSPPKEDICYATTNRQGAIKELAKKAQLVLVVGSKNSSNSNRLREVAEAAGAKAHLIDEASEIDPSWLEGVEVVAVTAGASAPENLVEGVASLLKEYGGEAEEVEVVDENILFTLPKEILQEAKESGIGREILNKHDIKTNGKLHAS